jgi:hypothetical protein
MRTLLPLLLVTSTACQSKTGDTLLQVESNNSPPVADCGADISITADQPVMLDGGASYDPDGDSITYHWSFQRLPEGSVLEGASFTTNQSMVSSTTFLPDVAGMYIVSLVVQDSLGLDSIADSIIVTVEPGALPVALAGTDIDITEGSTVTIDGTSSYDPLGRSLSYDWSITSQPSNSTSSIDDAAATTAEFTPAVPGLYLVSLVVSNGISSSAPDLVHVRVSSANPMPPTANAGGDQSGLEDCTSIALDGSASFDPNGDQLGYFWSLQSQPADSSANISSFSSREEESPTFFPDVAGEYKISLAVNDGTAWSSPDLITLDTVERATNSAPSVNAGTPMTVDGGDAACTASGYSYLCDECGSVSIDLGASASVVDADGDPLSVEWSVVSGDASISDPTSQVTTAILESAAPTEPNACENNEYELMLTATDCPGEQSSNSVIMTVTCCGTE